jgi:hypothetical protein
VCAGVCVCVGVGVGVGVCGCGCGCGCCVVDAVIHWYSLLLYVVLSDRFPGKITCLSRLCCAALSFSFLICPALSCANQQLSTG